MKAGLLPPASPWRVRRVGRRRPKVGASPRNDAENIFSPGRVTLLTISRFNDIHADSLPIELKQDAGIFRTV